MEFVHVLQAACNTSQLNGSSVRLVRDRVTTYKFGAVYMPIPLDELVYVSVVHPLGNQSEPVFVQRYPQQR